MSDVTVNNNQITIQSYKPKVMEMHSRGDLEAFQEAANAVGIGLQWGTWRLSVEVGSNLYKELINSGAVDEYYILELLSKVCSF